jgi:hypothetical protein
LCQVFQRLPVKDLHLASVDDDDTVPLQAAEDACKGLPSQTDFPGGEIQGQEIDVLTAADFAIAPGFQEPAIGLIKEIVRHPAYRGHFMIETSLPPGALQATGHQGEKIAVKGGIMVDDGEKRRDAKACYGKRGYGLGKGCVMAVRQEKGGKSHVLTGVGDPDDILFAVLANIILFYLAAQDKEKVVDTGLCHEEHLVASELAELSQGSQISASLLPESLKEQGGCQQLLMIRAEKFTAGENAAGNRRVAQPLVIVPKGLETVCHLFELLQDCVHVFRSVPSFIFGNSLLQLKYLAGKRR